ncbi:MAG: SNF2-related protein, partial [Desulfovibrionaceae bacterium]|nr:SNF2-related protein [Desulfovibrionaceae bacterium]
MLDVLSAQQRKRLESGRISSLGGLDLAALLRVLDSNWHLLSDILNLTYQDRHFLKEMQLIRNRWAHRSSEGFSGEDIYRDLDTIKRFLRFVGADERTTEEIQAVKKRLLEAENEALDTPDTPGTADGGAGGTDSAEGESAPEFEMGQMVRLKSNPDMRGAVVGVLPGTPEARFNVFINNGVQTLYASQLLHETVTEEKQNLVSCEEFHAYLTALQLRHPSLSNLYSLNAARINYIPYQFRPVLRFIRSDRPRLLIADSVGVGKTIEAGLILRELQARRDLRSVLIICPKPLLTEKKWQREMKRFEENFTQLDGATLQYCIEEMDLDGVWPGQHQKCILPYSLLDEALLLGSGGGRRTKRKKGLLDLDPAPRFDLVIVDEAHHIRNPGTLRHRAVRFFCDHAEAVVFLTATPVQMGSRDLFVLLNALRPDLVIDQETFEHMAAPNSHINAAVAAMRSRSESWQEDAFLALGQAAATPWGEAILRNNPDFCRIRAALQEPSVSGEERVRMISDTENLHSFSGIINRTRRCDIGSFTVRKPETVLVDFTPGQKLLHDELLRIQAEVYSRLFDKAAVKFLMTTIRRQAASCVFGLAPFLEEILGRHLGELGLEEGDDLEQLDGGTVTAMQGEIRGLLERTKKIDPADPKYDALCRLVRDKQKLRNNKIMLFSSFRHTLNYLYERLSREGFRVGLVHGGVPDEQRLALRRRFERDMSEPDGIDIMLFSEIGCEGLDYQFCDCIV